MPLFYHKYVNYVLAHSVNYVITLYSLPLQLHRMLSPSQPLQKDNNPSPRITLAPLAEGEVLSPDKIRATTGGIATPLSLAPHNILASLVKGRRIDGKPQTVALLRFACDTSAFFIHQTFCRQDGGIAIPPFA